MRFPTIWYVGPAKAQISLCIHAVWSEPLLLLEYPMTVKLLTEQYLEFLSLKGGCTSECTHVKMPHCWKSRHGSYKVHAILSSSVTSHPVSSTVTLIRLLKYLKLVTTLFLPIKGYMYSKCSFGEVNSQINCRKFCFKMWFPSGYQTWYLPKWTFWLNMVWNLCFISNWGIAKCQTIPDSISPIYCRKFLTSQSDVGLQ